MTRFKRQYVYLLDFDVMGIILDIRWVNYMSPPRIPAAYKAGWVVIGKIVIGDRDEIK